MRPLLPALLCLSLLVCAVTTFADPVSPVSDPVSPNRLRADILYTHQGEFVQVKPMRPLTLNAHVEQFAYDPLGLEIAYVGSEPQGENTLHFVKTVDARTGHELSRFTVIAPADSQDTGLMLRGWSVSGKYLLLQRFSPDPNEPQTAVSEFLRWDLSTSPPTTRTIRPETALPPEQQSADLEGSADCYPSPDGRWLAFTQSIHTQAADGKPGPDKNAYLLYEPERDKFLPLTLPPNTSFYSWADATHLKIWQGTQRKRFDVITGEISPFTTTPDTTPPDVSKQYPDLSLEVERRSLKNETVKESVGSVDAVIVWVRRSPFGKIPLGVAAAGLMPAQANNFQTTWSPTSAQSILSPTGKQVAFIANDDLYVTDLVTASGAMPREKMAAGLTLDCADEQVLAESNLKQIGLALIQYAQDFDEHFPPTENIEKTLAPYLKSQDVFSVGSTRWVYHGASDVSLASIESPADTVQATMDLPCAHLVLYFDGHVKAYPKQEPTP